LRAALPHLFVELGSEDDVPLGSAITIIGYPFSATGRFGEPIADKFCLSGTIASRTSNKDGNGTVELVYFQGPSIKEISGSPMIALDTGKVIGIANVKLTGLNKSLQQMRVDIAHGLGGNVSISGLEPGPAIDKILELLDSQLVNGLGSGTGAADAYYAVKKAQRNYQHTLPH